MQEALVHLWQTEEQNPGKSEAWYLQSCRFHLQNHQRRGRSVDSTKHRWDQLEVGIEPAESAELNEDPWGQLMISDFVAELSQWLTPPEKEILLCLLEGLSARETARRLNVSHTLINRHRSQISAMASKLGMAASRNRPKRGP